MTTATGRSRRPELPTWARLGAYALAVTVAFGVAYGAGAAVGPGVAETTGGHDESGPAGGDDPHAGAGDGEAAHVDGLAVAQDGYTLVVDRATLPSGSAVPFRFAVTGPDGERVTDVEVEHEKPLHLVVVRRDAAEYQHVHPTLGTDGWWSVQLDLGSGGTYRALADLTPAGGPALVLGSDVQVPGTYEPVSLPAPGTAVSVDGYDVSLSPAHEPAPGQEVELTFTITRDGVPVEDLDPYLGSYGHLVSLRAGDLAYLHTHPTREAVTGQAGGPEVAFETTFPSAGAYRLYLDFSAGGSLHTAELTVDVRSSR